jgi:hypothetical protein
MLVYVAMPILKNEADTTTERFQIGWEKNIQRELITDFQTEKKMKNTSVC